MTCKISSHNCSSGPGFSLLLLLWSSGKSNEFEEKSNTSVAIEELESNSLGKLPEKLLLRKRDVSSDAWARLAGISSDSALKERFEMAKMGEIFGHIGKKLSKEFVVG
ncbi:hypothetical protein AMTR_s00024p00194130 [Amborella trichopoda]|uniref:Uncharacterized protein n=1 Tax=Amborella trichopoda TaxID=13333 RepID=W1PV69_AMBTC|nr:hypothetical protein AMTR_s00024p00194130 [Amborella trichopoda]